MNHVIQNASFAMAKRKPFPSPTTEYKITENVFASRHFHFVHVNHVTQNASSAVLKQIPSLFPSNGNGGRYPREVIRACVGGLFSPFRNGTGAGYTPSPRHPFEKIYMYMYIIIYILIMILSIILLIIHVY
ncbi:unnamed protein product [Coffea canephora]|uniref:Uncharacterized protein n=1 Tax=Coffea canephora TaxID=49390 RepID=A0A068U402_COFCA|nr:unnamed protein product [Coffea canephora]